jgi:hypothetical protein
MPTFIVHPYTALMCDALDLLVDGVIHHLVMNTAPQVGKSELVSRKMPPFALGKNPDWKVILTCYNAALAYDLSRSARNLVKTDEYQRVFGSLAVDDEEDAVKLSEDSRSVANWTLSGRRGGMLAAGVGGGLPGHAADVLIIDDPVKDDTEAQSESFREAQHHWFWSVAYGRVSRDVHRIVLCQTRWNEDDLTGRILKGQSSTNQWWYVLRLPAEAEKPSEIEAWADKYNVSPEFYLTKKRVVELREMLPSERPHIKKRNNA